MKRKVLVTGGAGYIGSHTVLELLGEAHEVLILDNFCNSSPILIERIKRLSNITIDCAEIDILDQSSLKTVFADFRPDSVIHFAGLKSVGEYAKKPLLYYRNNIVITLSLLEEMEKHSCKEIVFSSSATVYGNPLYLPIDENHACSPTNAYGRTKFFIEEILKDWVKTGKDKKAISLRYFNPAGARASARIGEHPNGIPNNLMPFLSQVTIGKLQALKIFGNDYDTPDGTGIRDYLHFVDLAKAHLAALKSFSRLKGFEAVNLGTGNGVSVLEMIAAFEKAAGISIPTQIAPCRSGDVAASWADPLNAKKLLKWQSERTLVDMCKYTWEWQKANPKGF